MVSSQCFQQNEEIQMKNVLATIMLIGFAVVAYAGNSNPDEALFAEGTCYEQNGYCELTDFRGQTHEYEFAELGKNVAVYTGPQTNGVSCSGPICTNAQNQVIGLNPAYKDPYAGSSQQPQTTTQQPVQQASEPPYTLDSKVTNIGSVAYPVPSKQLLIMSKVNGLKIKNVVINEGNVNCVQFGTKSILTGHEKTNLDMGEVMAVRVPNLCNFVKMEIETNMGSWIHSF